MMMMSSAYSTTIMFLPISPNPPSGTMRILEPGPRRGAWGCSGLTLSPADGTWHSALKAEEVELAGFLWRRLCCDWDWDWGWLFTFFHILEYFQAI